MNTTTEGTRPHTDTSDAGSARYLTFTLNDEIYALNIFHVTEILEHRHLTIVPMMPDSIRGVINLRGRVVPVIDLATRFGRGTTTIARRTSIIIVHINHPTTSQPTTDNNPTATPGAQDIGILVDAVNKVVRFAEDDIEPAPAFGAGIRADYISGMAKRDNDFIIVLNIDHVLSLNDMVSLNHTTTSAPGGAAASTGVTASTAAAGEGGEGGEPDTS